MAPPKVTQAKALFAVLAGGMRRPRVYYREKVLRSTVYPYPLSDVSQGEASFINGALLGLLPLYDVSQGAVLLDFAFVSARVDYDHTPTDNLAINADFSIDMSFETTFDGTLTASEANLAINADFSMDMSMYSVTFISYEQPISDNLAITADFSITMTKS
ncbi:hypothetical protein [Shewanella sp. Koi 1]